MPSRKHEMEVVYGDFFRYAVERERVRIRKEAGESQLTDDPILQKFRFCNVFREDDKTTRWFATHVRDRLPVDHVLLATVVFRWFNRIEVGEAIWTQTNLLDNGRTAWEQFWITRDTKVLKRAIIASIGKKGPFVTGSYIIKGWDGLPKLDGVLRCIQEFMAVAPVPPDYDHAVDWEMMTEAMLRQTGEITLQAVHGWLAQHRYMGAFMAYEVVTDLYNTPLLRNAPDIMSWANPGPGAARGLNRIFDRPLTQKSGATSTMLDEMRDILKASRNPRLWTFARKRQWDMRTVEHTLCEFDKYERVRTGAGRPRQVYRHS